MESAFQADSTYLRAEVFGIEVERLEKNPVRPQKSQRGRSVLIRLNPSNPWFLLEKSRINHADLQQGYAAPRPRHYGAS